MVHASRYTPQSAHLVIMLPVSLHVASVLSDVPLVWPFFGTVSRPSDAPQSRQYFSEVPAAMQVAGMTTRTSVCICLHSAAVTVTGMDADLPNAVTVRVVVPSLRPTMLFPLTAATEGSVTDQTASFTVICR